MLEAFLNDAASAYAASGNDVALSVADQLRQINVPVNWAVKGQIPNQQSLEQTLAARDCHSSARHLAVIANQLDWVKATKFRVLSPLFKGNYCFTRIIGPDSLIENNQFRFGVYLQDAKTVYPSHRHEAEELYLPVSGTALWQKDNAPFNKVKSGTLIHHLSYQPHATTTDETPMLAYWAWVGNLAMETYSYVNQ